MTRNIDILTNKAATECSVCGAQNAVACNVIIDGCIFWKCWKCLTMFSWYGVYGVYVN